MSDTFSEFGFLDDREALAHIGDGLDNFENGIYTDEISEVAEVTDEMILGPSYISYAGEPQMDANALMCFANMVGAMMEIDRLTFDRVAPFECPFG